jgi:hypothetical protein
MSKDEVFFHSEGKKTFTFWFIRAIKNARSGDPALSHKRNPYGVIHGPRPIRL